MTVTDRLREAIEKYGTPLADNRVVLNLDDVPRIAYRAAIEAALAVQPVPTDAEIEQAIDRLALQVRMMMGPTVAMGDQMVFPLECVNEPCVKQRANLLRLIAARRAAARRDALEAVRWRASNLPYPNAYPCCSCVFDGRDEAEKQIAAHIDAMLAKEDGDE